MPVQYLAPHRFCLQTSKVGAEGGQTHQSSTIDILRPYVDREPPSEFCQLCSNGATRKVRALAFCPLAVV